MVWAAIQLESGGVKNGMGQQKRDNVYYLQRLKDNWPGLYAGVQSGKISVPQARRQAGLGGGRTRLHELKNAWSKATPIERVNFLSWASLAGSSASPLSTGASAWDADRRMREWAKRRIPEIMGRRGIPLTQLADELGINRLDQSVMMAMRNGSKVRSFTTSSAIDKWLTDNSAV